MPLHNRTHAPPTLGTTLTNTPSPPTTSIISKPSAKLSGITAMPMPDCSVQSPGTRKLSVTKTPLPNHPLATTFDSITSDAGPGFKPGTTGCGNSDHRGEEKSNTVSFSYGAAHE